MTILPLLLCGIWAVVANLAALLPSDRWGWLAALLPVATGIPLLGLVTWFYGPIAGLFAFGVGFVLLRWPMRLASQRSLRRREGETRVEPQAQPAE